VSRSSGAPTSRGAGWYLPRSVRGAFARARCPLAPRAAPCVSCTGNMMQAEMQRGAEFDEEGAHRGQTTLTDFFPARFKGVQQLCKASAPSRHAAAVHSKQTQADVAGRTAAPGAHSCDPLAAGNEGPDAQRLPEYSSLPANLSLDARIERARAGARQTVSDDVCCYTEVSRCRSIGIALSRATTPDTQGRTSLLGMPQRTFSVGTFSVEDAIQLDPASAICAVKDAARAFSKALYMVRTTGPTTAIPPSSTMTATGGNTAQDLVDHPRFKEEPRLQSQGSSDNHSLSSRTSSVAPSVAPDLWYGSRSAAASLESSPCGKAHARALWGGSERSDKASATDMLGGLEVELGEDKGAHRGHAGSLSAGPHVGGSEDERGRKRRYDSVSSTASAEAVDVHGGAAWRSSSSPKRMRPALPLPAKVGGSAAGFRNSRQRGGFALLNTKACGKSTTAAHRKQMQRQAQLQPSAAKLQALHVSASLSPSPSLSPSKKFRVNVKHESSAHKMPAQRTCVASPFGILKPSSCSGENTLRNINQVVQQTSLHKQQRFASSSSCTFSPMMGGSPVEGSEADLLVSWTGGARVASFPLHTPPRNVETPRNVDNSDIPHEDPAMSTLLCDENLDGDSMLYLSPRYALSPPPPPPPLFSLSLSRPL
jgi:hypothetical protein